MRVIYHVIRHINKAIALTGSALINQRNNPASTRHLTSIGLMLGRHWVNITRHSTVLNCSQSHLAGLATSQKLQESLLNTTLLPVELSAFI